MTELNLITDRTQADVDYALALKKRGWGGMTAAERAEWTAGLKGAYNTTDLNRVGEALNFLREALADEGYISPNLFVAKTNWVATDIPTERDLSEYLSFVDSIRNATVQFADTPLTPVYTGTLSYRSANDIEKILLAAEHILCNIRNAWFFCDDFHCGEV